MGSKAGEFIQSLTRNHDVIVIGGLAMIAHGFNRPTKDANALFRRYVDWQTCEAALGNPDRSVKDLAMHYLREFAAEGDPFSAAILEEREIP